MSENFSNTYQTTLNDAGGINNTDTSMIVTSATGSPAVNFRVKIEDEYMLVTAKVGTTFTITRGIEGSTAASHADGSTVTHVLTAGGLEAFVWTTGSSFPVSPTADARHYHTGLNLLFFYDGTRWLTTTLYTAMVHMQRALNPASANTTVDSTFPHPTMDIWLVDFWANAFVNTTNDGTRYWTLTGTAALNNTVLSTINNSPNTWVQESAAVNALSTNTAILGVNVAKVSTPGSIFFAASYSYRLVGT